MLRNFHRVQSISREQKFLGQVYLSSCSQCESLGTVLQVHSEIPGENFEVVMGDEALPVSQVEGCVDTFEVESTQCFVENDCAQSEGPLLCVFLLEDLPASGTVASIATPEHVEEFELPAEDTIEGASCDSGFLYYHVPFD